MQNTITQQNQHIFFQNQYRNFSLSGIQDQEPFLTSNRFILIQNPIGGHPYIQLRFKSKKLILSKDMTLKDFEMQLKANGEAKESVNFYGADGALLAKSTSFLFIFHIPYFIIKIDNFKEYNVINEKSFSFRNSKFTLSPDEKVIFDNCKELCMRDKKALEISRFILPFENDILKKNQWNQNELLIVIRDVLARKAGSVRREREALEQQLLLLKQQRLPMLHMINDIEKKAYTTTKRVVFSFCGVILSQYLLIQYGTYVAFSWDIMEPITCGMTLGDAVCAYVFWIWSNKAYSINGLSEFFFERKKNKLIKKHYLDYDHFQKTQDAIKMIKARLQELQ